MVLPEKKPSKQSWYDETNGALKKQKSIMDFITSYLAVNFHKLDDDQLVHNHAHMLGHPAGVFNKIQIPPSFFPIRHFQSADSQ